MLIGHPLLDEIKQGRRLRPTQTVDKSRPVILAEGERIPDVKCQDAPRAPPPPPQAGPFSYNPPPPPPPTSTLRNRTPSNPTLLKLGGKGDRDALLKSIKSGGVRLRKAVTNDKSGLILSDEELAAIRSRSSASNLVNMGSETSGSRDTLDSQGISYTQSSGEESSSERPNFRISDSESDSAYGGYASAPSASAHKYTSPPPAPPPPPMPSSFQSSSWSMRSSEPPPSSSASSPETPKPKPDYYFDENSLKVTKEDLEREISAGSAQAKIAAFTRFQEQQNGSYSPRFQRPTPGKIQIREPNFNTLPSRGFNGHESRATGSLANRVNAMFQRQESEPPTTRYNTWSNGASYHGKSPSLDHTNGSSVSSSRATNGCGYSSASSNGYNDSTPVQTPTSSYPKNPVNGTMPQTNGTVNINTSAIPSQYWINSSAKKVSFSDTEHEPRSRSVAIMDRSSLPPLPRDPSPKKAPRDPSPQKYQRDLSPQKPSYPKEFSASIVRGETNNPTETIQKARSESPQKPASFATDFRPMSPLKSMLSPSLPVKTPLADQTSHVPRSFTSFATEFRPTSPVKPAFEVPIRDPSPVKPVQTSSPASISAYATECRPKSPVKPFFEAQNRDPSPVKPTSTFNPTPSAPILQKYSLPITVKTDLNDPPPVPITSPPSLSPQRSALSPILTQKLSHQTNGSLSSPIRPIQTSTPVPSPSLNAASQSSPSPQPSPASNVGFGPYKFNRKLSTDISQPKGSPNFVTNKIYQSIMSPASSDKEESSKASFYSAQSSPSGYSTISDNRSRSTVNSQLTNAEYLSPNSTTSSSLSSPPTRSLSGSPRAQNDPNGDVPKIKPGDYLSATLGRSFPLKSGTAGEEHSAHFEKLRQSFNAGIPRPVRRTISSGNAVENVNGFEDAPKSGEAVWKSAVLKKNSPEKQIVFPENGTSKNSMDVPIRAPWYRREDYPDEQNNMAPTFMIHNGASSNGSSSDAQDVQNGNPSGASHKIPVKAPKSSIFDDIDPQTLRTNFMFAIDLSKDRPIEIVQR